MESSIENAVIVAGKVAGTLAELEVRHVNEPRLKVLHAQLNSLAIMAEDLLQQPRGTFGGVVGGTVHADSGGTDKGTDD